MIADVTPPPVRGRAFGFHRAADHFGSIPGSLIAWWLLSHTVDVRRVLGLSILPGVLAAAVLLVVLQSGPGGRVPEASSHPLAQPSGRVFWAPVLTLATLVLLRLPETLLLLRLQDLGVAVPLIPLVWAGLHGVRTLASYPGGWLTDHLGPRGTVAAGSAWFALAALALGLPLTAPVAMGCFLALGIVAGLTESAERSLVARLSPRRTGRGFGAYHATTGLAALPAALLFGTLYQHWGAPTALWASAGGILLTTVAWLAVSPAGKG